MSGVLTQLATTAPSRGVWLAVWLKNDSFGLLHNYQVKISSRKQTELCLCVAWYSKLVATTLRRLKLFRLSVLLAEVWRRMLPLYSSVDLPGALLLVNVWICHHTDSLVCARDSQLLTNTRPSPHRGSKTSDNFYYITSCAKRFSTYNQRKWTYRVVW